MSKRATKVEREYMARVQALGCVVCQGEAVVHHKTGAGMGLRSSHYETFGLCHNHHVGAEGIHTIGKRVWQDKYGYESEFVALVQEALRYNTERDAETSPP